MSGGSVLTSVGRDQIANILMDRILYFKLGEGGFVLSDEVFEDITTDAVGGENSYAYTISGGDFSIIGVDIGDNSFEISGEQGDFFFIGAVIKVEGSTGNDGTYTVLSVVESGDTTITVNEDLTNAVADGSLYINRVPVAKGPSSDSSHFPLVIEELNGAVVVQSVSDTTGTGVLYGDGSGTINYKTGEISVSFDDNVATGRTVRVRFKYHDRKKDVSGGSGYEDLESELSTIQPDGDRELYTYRKDFGDDADTVVSVRGEGYGTVRCTMKLQLWDGTDDGRGSTYGGIPFYFEGGVFDDEDVMIGYFTFDKQRKTSSVEVVHTFDFVF